MKKLFILLVIALINLSNPSISQVIVIDEDEIDVKMKDRYCLFGGSVCAKVKTKGTIVYQ